MTKQANPYKVAIMTGLITGCITILGTYLTHKYLVNQTILAIELKSRNYAYTHFLEKIDRKNAPVISQVLSIGALADRVATDFEMQSLEDKFHVLLAEHDIQDIVWKLSNDFNLLKLYGSDQIKAYAEDILNVLTSNSIELNNYSPEVRRYYETWQRLQSEGIAYGWEERVSDEDRLSLVVTAALLQNLITTMRDEIHMSPV